MPNHFFALMMTFIASLTLLGAGALLHFFDHSTAPTALGYGAFLLILSALYALLVRAGVLTDD